MIGKSGSEQQKSQKEKALAVHRRLLEVYGLAEWRVPLPALDELISTILSQNTNDTNRDVAFNRLKERFSNWEAVRDAASQDVIEAIRPAGLANQKGPRIQAVLRQISKETGELSLDFLKDWPAEKAHDWLLRFNGVGPKTAAIVMVFSLGLPAFPVDTHIYRVSGRIGLRPPKMTAEQAHIHLAVLFPEDEYGPAHLNLIRLGREVCHPRKPECLRCPVADWCDYFESIRRT
jgi:endonuclease-3